MRIIDKATWNRKEHFDFFTKMDSPYFGIVTEVDCTKAFAKVKELQQSFFATYMHKSMMAINQTEEFKYRIVDGQVVVFDVIHAGTTIGREDGTFGFAFIPFSEDFAVFNQELQREILEVQNSSGLRLNNDDLKKDLIRHSTLPWSSFSGLLHPTNFNNDESVPKITFGKVFMREGKQFLPLSIEANHGLVDGYHIAKYLEKFQMYLDTV